MSDTPESLPVVGSKVIVHPKSKAADWAEGWPGTVIDIETCRFGGFLGDYRVDLAGHGGVWFELDEIEVTS